MTPELQRRLRDVMDAAERTTVYTTWCSVCGSPPDPRRGFGAAHAVANPGHVVTAKTTYTTIYRDTGKEV